jgi:hypothetical protein
MTIEPQKKPSCPFPFTYRRHAVIAFSLLTFFYSACSLALRAVLRTFTSLREDVARKRK